MALERRRLAVVDTRRVDADGPYDTVLGQPPRGLRRQSGEMQQWHGIGTRRRRAEVRCPIRPALTPPRSQQDDGPGGDGTVRGLEGLEVGG